MQEPTLCIGVDVSKAELVIAIGPQRRPCSVANDAVSISSWLREIPAHALIAMESTGRYHGLLAHLASQAGLKVYVLNARDVFFYARALGTRAKTDGVDAGVIARYLVEHHARLHPWQPGSSVQQRLQDLLTRRAQVVMHRSALRQVLYGRRYEGHRHCNPAGGVRYRFAVDRRPGAGIDHQRRADGPGMRAFAHDHRHRPPDFGAAGHAAEPLRLRQCRCTGRLQWSGSAPQRLRYQARTTWLSKKGPPLLRRQMYLAGFAASHSKALKPLYQSIRAKGFATTEALVILGRKLLRVAFAVWKGNEVFDPARLLPRET